MYLLKKAEFVATDSGTVVEEACILNVPSIQMRYSTERPEVYDVIHLLNLIQQKVILNFGEIIEKVKSI